jgi:hypothetical protein
MSEKDARWIQRFHNYSKALGQLSRFIEKKELNELEQQGLIQAFEYTYDWPGTPSRIFLKTRGKPGFTAAGMRSVWRFGVAWLKMDRHGWT